MTEVNMDIRVDDPSDTGDLDPNDCLRHPDKHLTELQRLWIETPLPQATRVKRSLHWIVVRLMRTLFRVKAVGCIDVPTDSQMIITPNHTSQLDALAVAAALPYSVIRDTRWAGWSRRIARNPLQRVLARYVGTVPVNKDPTALSAASAVLDRGESLVWYPEGHRTETGDLQQFRRGIGFLLQKYDLPVIPMAVTGAFESLPPSGGFRGFHPVTVKIGKSVRRDDLPMSSPEETADALHDIVQELSETKADTTP